MADNNTKGTRTEVRKGDLVVASSKSMKKYHKGLGFVLRVVPGKSGDGFWIYWGKRGNKTYWAEGRQFLKRVDKRNR